MQINLSALKRLNEAKLNGPGLARIFETLAQSLREGFGETGSVVLEYQTADDHIEPGDLYPTIILALRPAANLEGEDGPSDDSDDDSDVARKPGAEGTVCE